MQSFIITENKLFSLWRSSRLRQPGHTFSFFFDALYLRIDCPTDKSERRKVEADGQMIANYRLS